ncbi:MAG: polysaccharide deacetylase family protein [Lachnospiraceae bacterium]|nr:polysaccharide deacetylase family protein [Lachnospiraceae bacterium]
MKKRMITVLAAAILFAMAVPGCVFAAETANAEKKTAEETQVQTPKDGFRVKNGKTYYYLNGKKVKKKWIEKDGKTYYFDKKGRMVRGKVKTKKTMYYFDDNGVFLHKIKIKKKMIALTYDDGPSAYTPMIVKELKKVGGRATFFVVGNRVNSYKKQMKEAFKAGCEIGNHSWNHANLNTLSASGIRSQMSKTNTAVKKVTGVKPAVMRPPYGANNSRVKGTVGMPLITWNVDTLDWKTRSTSATVSHVKNHHGDGSIILMHDIHRPTAMAAKTIIPWLAKKGYQLVTVSELADCRGGLKKGVTYSSFRKK